MIIMPTATPLALTDVNQNNQTQQQHIQNSEQSKKTTDTVQVSAQAREMAGSGLENGSAGSHTIPVSAPAVSDREAVEKVADNEVAEQQRPSNPLTGIPETTKIDIVV